ncbi:hypothetical protein DFJ43DRAFT_1149804 [Lentinula guzmanii]|uniref:Uncharacterized protein n=1 Tax=Lentinula guzmanii TaxID=2804957 RepID=A0AA38JRA0_9AGAR|nr:hypothetical protein DFJ43DRAFT_1149804 [Lentinula guzmanii]
MAANAIDSVSPILSLAEIDYRTSSSHGSPGYLTVADLTLQLRWHKKHGIRDLIPTKESSWGRREDKIMLLKSAVEKYNDLHASTVDHSRGEEEEEPEVTVQDLQDYNSEEYDSEEDYYASSRK